MRKWLKWLKWLFVNKSFMTGDLSKHRKYTTNYEDLCM